MSIDGLPLALKELKKYVKKNGHFVLLEMEDKEGLSLSIKI